MKYPTVYPLLDKRYQKAKPIYPEPTKPTKPSVLMTIFLVLFEIWFIVDLILDIVNNKEIQMIIVDVLCLALYSVLNFVVIKMWKDYRAIKKIFEEFDEFDKLSDANPLVEMKKLLAFYSRNKYIQVKNLTDFEYEKMKGRAPKKYAKLMEALPEDTETCSKLLRIAVKDPSVLKEFTKFDKAEQRVSDAIYNKYFELAHKTPEELSKIEKDYDHLDGMRKFSRKWLQKKKK